MQQAGVVTAAAVVLPEVPRLPLRSAVRAVAADGTSAFSMATHIHSSFSEQSGSMDSQLFQATKNSVDVLWWTDHDHRMATMPARPQRLAKQTDAAELGSSLNWVTLRLQIPRGRLPHVGSYGAEPGVEPGQPDGVVK